VFNFVRQRNKISGLNQGSGWFYVRTNLHKPFQNFRQCKAPSLRIILHTDRTQRLLARQLINPRPSFNRSIQYAETLEKMPIIAQTAKR